jgi:arsenate reductase
MNSNNPRVCFVCVGNSARSQMAEGLLRKFANEKIDVQSCGTHVSRIVHPISIVVMDELGIDINHHRTKTARAVNAADYIISMCEEDATNCEVTKLKDSIAVNWQLPDPAKVALMLPDENSKKIPFRQVRDSLKTRVDDLINVLDSEGFSQLDVETRRSALRKIHDDELTNDMRTTIQTSPLDNELSSNPTELTIGTLIQDMTPAQFWRALCALGSALALAFFIGKSFSLT